MAKKKAQVSVEQSAESAESKIAAAITDFLGNIPTTKVRKSSEPELHAEEMTSVAARQAAVRAGALALPPGPLGWLTILPEMIMVWRIQAQLVADISALYGKKSTLTKEQMLYCLFKHSAAQALRDIITRVGERVLVKRATLRVLQDVARKIGIRITQRVIGKGIGRWLPFIGAGAVAAYAYYDTTQVGKTATEFFSQDIEVES